MSRPYPMLIPSLAATLGLLARALSAQPPAQSNEKAVLHTHSAPLSDQVIDGATHPELIPDSTAYRLVFVVIASPQTRRRKELRCKRRDSTRPGSQATTHRPLLAFSQPSRQSTLIS